MKKLSIILCLFYLLAGNLNAQVEFPKPTAAEEQEAKNLAVSFFNRFQETQDLTPLIKEYFVRDFTRRLNFCGTTQECEGRFRDFWKKNDFFVAVNAASADHQRFYIDNINYFFLYDRSIRYLNDNYPLPMSDDNQKAAEKSLENELKAILKDDPGLLKYNHLHDYDEELFGTQPKSLKSLRRFLDDYEKFIAALKIVEANLRANFLKKNPNANIAYTLTNFRVDIEENYNRFFDYPVGTRIVEVWCKNDSLLFTVSLIEEKGKLKIVAIYLPMD